jgi:homocysteine S-methyltransferase
MADLPTLLTQGPVTLDGSMSTPLEAWGEDTNSDLWTAKALADNPDLVYRVHQEYTSRPAPGSRSPTATRPACRPS